MLHNSIPAISKEQMQEVDRLMVECYGIELIQMMENAGRSLAELARRQLGFLSESKNICIVAGPGNNGGGGLVAARFLSNWGFTVTVLCTHTYHEFSEIAAKQFEIINDLPVSLAFAESHTKHINWEQFDLVIDAILGYGINRKPEGVVAQTIYQINSMNCPVLSLDLPSGLDSDQGVIYNETVKADFTLTLALPKIGLMKDNATAFIGDLYIADISIPPLLYCQLGLNVEPFFDRGPIVLYKSKKEWSPNKINI